MRVVKIDCCRIVDWQSFHDVFSRAMGFPGFYGRNMDAWIDCMSCVDDVQAGMSRVIIEPGERLTIALENASSFQRRCPEQYKALIESVAFVNDRRRETGEASVITLIFC